jgi:hypothetical protein
LRPIAIRTAFAWRLLRTLGRGPRDRVPEGRVCDAMGQCLIAAVGSVCIASAEGLVCRHFRAAGAPSRPPALALPACDWAATPLSSAPCVEEGDAQKASAYTSCSDCCPRLRSAR